MLKQKVNLKNNKIRENTTLESEHLIRLKHIALKYLQKRKHKEGIEKLRISWSDLSSSEMKGYFVQSLPLKVYRADVASRFCTGCTDF